MAASTTTYTKRDGTLTFKDGTGTPKTLVVGFYDGDLSLTPTVFEDVVQMNRGEVVGVRKGNRTSGTFSFTCKLNDVHTADTLARIFLDEGDNNSWTSVSHNITFEDVLLVDLVWALAKPGTAQSESITLEDVRVKIDSIADGDDCVISFSGVIYGDTTMA